MKIELRESDPGRLWPECRHLLRELPATATFHDEWGKRPPFGLYNVSLDTLPRRFAAVLDCLDKVAGVSLVPASSHDAEFIDLIDAHQALLYAMLEHLEDCRNVAAVFFPKAVPLGKQQLVRELQDAMGSYRNQLAHIVNAIKHRQARLGLVEAMSAGGNVLGFSVQNIVAPGTVGPDPDIHASRADSVPAISFMYDIRSRFQSVYAVGRHLANFIGRRRRDGRVPGSGVGAVGK